MYLRWRRLLPEWVRVVPVELPGRGSRLGEPFTEEFGELIAQLCQEHAPSLRRRHALFGHSMGGLLAYGMAQRQRALGCRGPELIIASACPAPTQRDPQRFAGKADDQALVAELLKQGGTPQELFESPDLLRQTLQTLRADYRVCDSYRSVGHGALAAPIHVFAGRQDDIRAEQLQAWSLETSGRFGIDWFEGGHFFLRQNEAALLAAIVRGLLHLFSKTPDAALAAA